MKIPVSVAVSERLTLLYSLMHYLDKSAVAVVVDAPNSVMEQVLNWHEFSFKRISSRALIERYGLWVEPQALSSLKLLGGEPGVVEYSSAIQAGLLNVPPPRVRLKCDSFDHAFGHLKKIECLFLNDNEISEILFGASISIRQHRPIVIIPRSRVIESFLKEWCESQDYCLFDEEITPIDYVVVPSERIWMEQVCKWSMAGGELDPLGLPPEGLSVAPMLSMAEKRSVLAGYSYRGLSEVLVNRTLRHGLDKSWAQKGWYESEGDENSVWRWSGPYPDSVVLVPVPAPGKYTLLLHLLHFVNESLIGKGQLFINGRHVLSLSEEATQEPLELVVDIPDEGFDGYLEVQLSLPETIQPSEYDLRRLGVTLGDIAISWQEVT